MAMNSGVRLDGSGTPATARASKINMKGRGAPPRIGSTFPSDPQAAAKLGETMAKVNSLDVGERGGYKA